MSALVISLDFEMFWGVTDSKTIENYGKNIEGVWQAIPAMLKLFKKYDVHATWATVGMLMCKDFKQWSDLRPSVMPTYPRESCSTYSFSKLASELPKLFFAPSLVEQIIATNGQELASHTYSHFYCGEENATVEQFAADLDCVKWIFGEYGVKPTSLVFPRNQIRVRNEYLKVLLNAGYTAYRGNQNHPLYRIGKTAPGAYSTLLGLLRHADTYLPFAGNHVYPLPNESHESQLTNIPTSKFVRPLSNNFCLNWLQLNRLKSGMLEAAKTNSVFHIWWHPHNFGKNVDSNLINLEKLLQHHQILKQEYGMRSMSMAELDTTCRTH